MNILEIFSYIVIPLLLFIIIPTTIDHFFILNKLKQQEKIFFSLQTQDRGGKYSIKEVDIKEESKKNE